MNKTYHHLPINDLFDELKKNDFRLTTEQKVWIHFAISKAVEEAAYNRLANFICPLVAHTPQQQTLFSEIYNRVFAVETIRPQDETKPDSKNTDTEKPPTETSPQKPSLLKRIKKWWNETKPKPINQTEPQNPNKKIAPKLIDDKMPDEVWAIGYQNIPVINTPQLRMAMQQMRRREFDELRELDIPATIRNTINKSGIFSPVFTQRTRTTEYLLLIDRSHPNSHPAAYAQQIAHSLQNLDVPVTVFYFNGLPYYCYNQSFMQGLKLETIESRYSKAVLMVFSPDFTQIFDSRGNFIPLARVLKRWQRRIIISSIPQAEWDYRHVILNKLFPLVLPAGNNSIQTLAVPYEQLLQTEKAKPRYWKRMAGFWDSSIATDTQLPVEHILAQYPNDFMKRWVAACAVWPELRWQLTLQLGKWLVEQNTDNTATTHFPTNEHILQLFRNEWFTQGYIPKHQRTQLQKQLTAEDKKYIAEKVIAAFSHELQNTAPAKTGDALFVVSLREIARTLSPEKQNQLQEKLSSNTTQNKIVALQYILPDILDTEIDLSDLSQLFEKMLSTATYEIEVWDIEPKEHNYPMDGRIFVYIKGGTFLMGSEEYDDEKPIHKVKVNDFYMAKYQVTNEEFAEFLNDYGSTKVKTGEYAGKEIIKENEWGIQSVGTGRDLSYKPAKGYEKHPVIHVTWYGAKEYCHWLSTKTGKTYRLPTEAEWEYAAGWKKNVGTGRDLSSQRGALRYAGTDNESELTDYAWYDKNSYDLGKEHPDYGTHPVGQKNPNPLGLYDMSGNVWEWCSDWYDEKYYEKCHEKGIVENPQGPQEASYRVLRGGGWFNDAGNCRVADRSYDNPTFRYYGLGFRLVLLP